VNGAGDVGAACVAGRDVSWADERIAPVVASASRTSSALGTKPGNNLDAFFRISHP
jgi:hypothetical protein